MGVFGTAGDMTLGALLGYTRRHTTRTDMKAESSPMCSVPNALSATVAAIFWDLLADLEEAPPRLQKPFADAKAAGLVAGACLQAASGCGSAEDRNIVAAIEARGVGFLSDLDNDVLVTSPKADTIGSSFTFSRHNR
jgi:hypothetical protein